MEVKAPCTWKIKVSRNVGSRARVARLISRLIGEQRQLGKRKAREGRRRVAVSRWWCLGGWRDNFRGRSRRGGVAYAFLTSRTVKRESTSNGTACTRA